MTGIDIVARHLPRGSKLQWREDMSGGLPSTWNNKIINQQSLTHTFIYMACIMQLAYIIWFQELIIVIK